MGKKPMRRKKSRKPRKQAQPSKSPPVSVTAPALIAPALAVWEDDFDRLSNSVVDLLQQGDLDAAEQACAQLREHYPDDIDWMERTGMVHEARGHYANAAEHYRMALAFTEQPEQASHFEDEGRQWYRDRIEEMERLASQAERRHL